MSSVGPISKEEFQMRLRTFVAAAAVALATAVLASPALANGTGNVYALSNSPAGNSVLVFHRGADGSLSAAGSVASGGLGTGGGLGSQGAVILSPNGKWLFAVNPGSNTISSFRIRVERLELVDTARSGGTLPTSVAFRGGLLYVLNAGVPNNVSGFTVSRKGELTPLANSARPLSAPSTAPTQVGFNDDGSSLIVTERTTNIIDTFAVDRDGYLSGAIIHVSSGPVPFGFAVSKRDTLIVSEAGPGGGASSYRIGEDAALDPVSTMVMTGQRAACWAVVTRNGRFGYVINGHGKHLRLLDRS